MPRYNVNKFVYASGLHYLYVRKDMRLIILYNYPDVYEKVFNHAAGLYKGPPQSESGGGNTGTFTPG